MTRKDDAEDLIRSRDIRGFDRWSLPSFDPQPELPEVPAEEDAPDAADECAAQSETVPEEQICLPTLEELEAIRQAAHDEGFASGEQAGYQAGQQKARQQAETALNGQLQRLEQLMAQLLAPVAGQDEALEQAMLQLVIQVVRQVIRRELQLDSSIIRQVLHEALGLLPMGAGNLCIYVSPQDFALIRQLRERHEENWRIREDSQLLPGGCRVETERSRIDASVEARLEQAISQLLAQQEENRRQPPEPDLPLDLEAAPGAARAP